MEYTDARIWKFVDKALYLKQEPGSGLKSGLTTDITIRRFGPNDLGSVMEINRTCLPENYSSSFFLEVHAKFPEGFLVAVNSDQVIAYIMCRVERGFSETSRFRFVRKGHVISIAVLPEYRRKGIGSELVRQAEKSLIEKESEECFLEVRASNKAAQELYNALEFRETRKIPFYYQNGEEAIVMTKTLVQIPSSRD